ncbi:MAG: ABC transporter substrate-binding protein [Clostridia bacterium]|nr:ABC transporter substrate-binding protein [Clostridia bacterium]
MMIKLKSFKIGKILLVIAILGLIILPLVGCGNGGSTNSSSGDNKSGSNATVGSTEPFKVGLIIPKSNVYATLGENLSNGMTMYFDEIGWKAGGREIQLLQEDEENDAQAALRKAKKLVESDKSDVLVGVVNSSIALAIRDYVDQNKVPFLVAHAGAVGLTRAKKSDYVYRISFTNEQVNFPNGKWTYENLGKKVFVIAPDYAAGKEQINGFKKGFTSAGGTIVGEAWPPLGTNDYGSYLQQITKAKPDAVYAFFAGTDAVRFVQQYSEFGLKKKIPLNGSGWLNAEDVRPAQGGAVEGVKGSLYWQLALDTPENKNFVENYKKKFGKEPSGEAVEGYDAARVIAEGLETLKGDSSDKLKVAQAWGDIKFVSPRGPIEFDKENHMIIQNIYLAETQKIDGKLQNKIIATFKNVKDPI